MIAPDGSVSSGRQEFWFIPGKLAFCLCCKGEPGLDVRERSELAGLFGAGHNSATTLLVLSALERMNAPASGVSLTKRKLLGFTNNR